MGMSSSVTSHGCSSLQDPERDWQELAAEEDAMALSDDSDAAAPQQPSSYTPSTTADRDMDTHDFDHDHLSDARFDDWDSPVPSASAPCLFCPHVESSAQSLLTTHLPTAHGFHATTLLGPLDFYDRVKLVNYTRRQMAHACCFACGHEAAGDEELGEHFEVAGCTRNGQLPVRDCAFWNDPQYVGDGVSDVTS